MKYGLLEGNEEYLKKHGIKRIAAGIGYSESEGKWYGWSHRAIYGFKPGDVVKEGDITAGTLPIGFKAKNEEDARKMAEAFAEGVS